MRYYQEYQSPLGRMGMAADEEGLTDLWFLERTHYPPKFDEEPVHVGTAGITGAPVDEDGALEYAGASGLRDFSQTREWLDQYFRGEIPKTMPKLHLIGSEFRREVWQQLLQIPYGQTTTYGEIAAGIATRRGAKSMSAQAVGGAVGHNPIIILIPCHRVIGKDGSLTGFGSGLDRKTWLLQREGIFLPNTREV